MTRAEQREALRAAILAQPADLPHAEAHRRLVAAGWTTTLATVKRVRSAWHGQRKPGRPSSDDTIALAALRTVAERHGVTIGEVIVAGDEALAVRR